MSAIITDQFRILNANNFVNSVQDTDNSYYVFLGLTNPKENGFGRSDEWNINTPAPSDSFSYRRHAGDTMMFGKKVSSANIRRLIRRVEWVQGTRYEIYRDDYSASNPSPNSSATRLYDANYYVVTSELKVYICIDNGSTGSNPLGNVSQDEPTFEGTEPSKAGNSGDGYVWKYLFTVPSSDTIKFDSTEFITVPNNWSTSTDAQIRAVRENGNSNINSNQIKHIFIENSGNKYAPDVVGAEVDIVGDGTGGRARIDIEDGKITNVTVSAGGKGYTWGRVDLSTYSNNADIKAKLIPIIPPARGHGDDIYSELGTDKVLLYARFDDSTKDFPVDSTFSQVGIVKNPTKIDSDVVYTDNTFSSLQAIKLQEFSNASVPPKIGEEITQKLTIPPNDGKVAKGYVSSYDETTRVLKYFRDRSLYFNNTTFDHTDEVGVNTTGRIYQFETGSTINDINGSSSGFSGKVEIAFSGITTNPSGAQLINLGTRFQAGLSDSEINKGSGQIIYLDNRPEINRSLRQKEDIKIVLEF